MTQVESLIHALKQVLKGRGVTYAELARRLEISESSVKRLLSRGGLTLERLEQICACLDTDFLELAKRMQREQAEPRDLSLQQEQALADDAQLLALAYHLVNGWTPARLRKTYGMSEAALTGALAKLDRLGLIDYMPGGAVKVKVARNLKWRPDGPLHRRYTQQALSEFFASSFGGKDARLRFMAREMSLDSMGRVLRQLDRLAAEFEELADLDQGLRDDARVNVGFVLGLRPWTFSVLTTLEPDGPGTTGRGLRSHNR